MPKKCESVDRSVKVLGPNGGLRGRRRYSQEAARGLLRAGVVVAIWNRRGDRIACIQFLGTDVTTRPERWLKTGTRYSYPEQVGNHKVWTHKSLPYRMVRADSHEPFNSVAINDRLRSLFAGPALSTVTIEPELPQNVASVISIESHRPRVMAVGGVDEEEPAALAA